MKLHKRLMSFPSGSFFLLGPRGTGKSTWLRQCFPSARFIDLLNDEDFRFLAARPERLCDMLAADSGQGCVVIDEIQRIPALLTTVHQLMERDKSIKFILTGSSARKLRREGVDLLAGRAALRTCHPFMAAEILNEFSLEKALLTGLVPVVAASESPADALRAYIHLYLKEEVLAEGLVRNFSAFSRFIEAAAFSHASLLNMNSVARECEVSRTTVEGYFSILNDLLISQRIPVFERRAKRKLIRHEKFYFFDAGVFRSLRPKGPMDSPSEMDGAALEGLVLQHLRAWNDYSGNPCSIHYWRTQSGVEVDFVLYGEDTFLAIEVKNSTRIHSGDTRSLRAFLTDYPEAQALLLYRGHHPQRINGILCLPCTDFLKNLTPSKTIL